MTIQVADGYDNSGALAALSKQPRTAPIQPGRRSRAGDGSLVIDGFYRSALIFGFLTVAEKTALLTELGLTSAESNQITIQLPDRDFAADSTWNAIVERDVDTEYFSMHLETIFPLILVEDITP